MPTQVFIYNGATGAHIDTITPPEDNPPRRNAATPYVSPELAFVYVETMPDLGSCPGGDGADADKICDHAQIGPEDGIPEIIVGSRALRVNATNGASARRSPTRRIGRGYVIDGKTRAVLKRIDMPVVDRQADVTRSGANSVQAFARTMASPQGMPPCAGLASENNDTGVGPVPEAIARGTGNTTSGSAVAHHERQPAAAGSARWSSAPAFRARRADHGHRQRKRDLDAWSVGAGHASRSATPPRPASRVTVEVPTIATRRPSGSATSTAAASRTSSITARGFPETTHGPTARRPTRRSPAHRGAGPQCREFAQCKAQRPIIPDAACHCGAGKVWVYRGEDIARHQPADDPSTPSD